MKPVESQNRLRISAALATAECTTPIFQTRVAQVQQDFIALLEIELACFGQSEWCQLFLKRQSIKGAEPGRDKSCLAGATPGVGRLLVWSVSSADLLKISVVPADLQLSLVDSASP